MLSEFTAATKSVRSSRSFDTRAPGRWVASHLRCYPAVLVLAVACGADDAQVAAAARRVGGGDWIDTLPHGLATEVAERGRNLSLGQRQLIALTRVLLQDPAILMLDEATASIDPLTEALVQEGMEELLRERTAIVIAHRLSTIKRADRIVVLRAGRIIEQGTHDDLLRDGGHYAERYDAYFRHQSLDYVQTAPPTAARSLDRS